MGKLLTTGEAAALAGVSRSLVVKWANRGMIRYTRIIGGRDRRIDRADFEAFLRRHGHWPRRVVVLLGFGPDGGSILAPVIAEETGARVVTADDWFAAGRATVGAHDVTVIVGGGVPLQQPEGVNVVVLPPPYRVADVVRAAAGGAKEKP